MPSTRVETQTGWIQGRHRNIVAAIQRALVEGIRIPEEDRDIRILEYPAEAFAPMPGRGAAYTVIEISMIKGRSLEAKRRLYSALSRELAAFGVGRGDLKVIIHEPPLENWSVGGKALSDMELGFKIDV
jgi:4-oxalocrotonate tautomerase family enzyme